jgi:ubiquinone/menaquinone biosynthesis C-methylase UbiE
MINWWKFNLGKKPKSRVDLDKEISYKNNHKITPAKYYSGLSDSLWFSLLLNPKSLELPGFPSEETQARFTGRSGFLTMIQAFEFYDVIRNTCLKSSKPLSSMDAILDFGCGWGRIIRIFLRDVEPEKLYGCDCTPEIVNICREMNKWCNFDLTNYFPPTGYKSSTFDLIYAYSVFSHLSEKYNKIWLEEFYRIMKPNGILCITIRQKNFIYKLKEAYPYMPDFSIEEALKKYENDDFVYFNTGGGFELTSDFYGEAFMSKKYVERELSKFFKIIDFIEGTENVDQSIIAAQKK